MPNVPVPIDDLDAAFMRHDLHYQALGYFNRRSDLQLIADIDEALLHGHVLPLGRALAPTIRMYFVFQVSAVTAGYLCTHG